MEPTYESDAGGTAGVDLRPDEIQHPRRRHRCSGVMLWMLEIAAANGGIDLANHLSEAVCDPVVGDQRGLLMSRAHPAILSKALRV